MEILELLIPPLPQLLTVGHTTWKPGNQHFKRRFDLYDVLFVVRGKFYMTEEEIAYEIGPGQILVLESGLEHWGHRPCEEETEIYWVHLKHAPPSRKVNFNAVPWSSVLPQGTDKDLFPTEQPFYIPKYANIDLHSVVPVLNEIVHLHRTLCRENAVLLHVKLGQLLVLLQAGLRGSMTSRSYTVCEEMKQALHQSYTEPFNAEALERTLHYNLDYASRCLKRHTGMSPLQYQHYLRIEEAKRLLRHSPLTIGEIGAKVGYSDDNYFIRTFKSKTGFSPGAYRRIYVEHRS
ncbi:helix-turn-helix transcriptional regulator [Paenibacillus koleovorans]|uniref:helix-turn-helix transcriptional regulator n=1 Tax=Paenibacillus koleovorans TaxID=121608 RepID=UPI000FDC4C8C|nr:AraC family transcriptional regulator [Paenibacillus koleovorans]